MERKWIVLAAVLLAAVLVVGVLAAGGYFSLSFSGRGNIAVVGIKAYSDQALTQELTSIDWGTIYPGSNSVRTGYFVNNGSIPITLSLVTQGWAPAAATTYITLSWNYNNMAIQPGAVVPVDLTVTASPATIGLTSFSFNMIVAASG